jgi:integrase
MNGNMRAPRPPSVGVNKDRSRGRYVVLCSVPEAGERRRYRQSFPSKREADAQADAIRTRLRAGLPPFETAAERGTGFTVLEVLDFYAGRPEGAASDRGEQHRAAFAATALASRPAEAFALEDLEGFIVARCSVAKRKASAATCAKDFRYLKAACAYAKAKGKISRHYFENLAGDRTTRKRLMPPYRVEESAGKEIPQAHLEAILSHLHRDARRAVLFARTSGCRKAEVAALDWQKHWSPEGFRPIVQKGSKPRVVACDPALVGPRGIGLVFSELGGTGAAIYARLTACWRYAVKAAKVGAYRFHDLRHSYGTDLRAAGRSFDDIAAIMGITSLMAHVYAHEDTEALQREAIQAGTNPAILALA